MAWGDQPFGFVQGTNPNQLTGSAKILIGAGGSVASCTGSPGVSCAVTGSGAFTLTYPTCPDVHISYSIQTQSEAAADSIDVAGVAASPTAGTATFRTTVGSTGAAVDPASGDELVATFTVFMSGRSL